MPELKTVVVSIMSPGVSKGAGGFVIVNGKLRKIPPHSPKLKELNAAFALMMQAEDVSSRKVRQQIGQLSETLIAESAAALAEESEE